MDICVITNDVQAARFIELELEEAGYSVCRAESEIGARLYIYDLDFKADAPDSAIGFSYDVSRRGTAQNFLLRPIDAEKLRHTVEKLLSEPTVAKAMSIEADSTTRKLKTANGEVRLSEKEFALFNALCTAKVLKREDGARIFGNSDSNVVDVYMHYLRKKLEKICSGETVKSKRGDGYTLSDKITVKFT